MQHLVLKATNPVDTASPFSIEEQMLFNRIRLALFAAGRAADAEAIARAIISLDPAEFQQALQTIEDELQLSRRYYNGTAWTADVATNGQRAIDPAGAPSWNPDWTAWAPGQAPPAVVGAKQPGRGMGIASFVVGLVSLLGAWLPFVFAVAAIGAVIGLILGTIGTDIHTGVARFTFGTSVLDEGLDFVPFAAGLFAFVEIAFRLGSYETRQQIKTKLRDVIPRWPDIRASAWPTVRGTALGAALGVLPGTGGLTRVTDKRRVRRDLADFFCTTSEGVRADRAKQWKLVDHLAPGLRDDEGVAEELPEQPIVSVRLHLHPDGVGVERAENFCYLFKGIFIQSIIICKDLLHYNLFSISFTLAVSSLIACKSKALMFPYLTVSLPSLPSLISSGAYGSTS